MNSSLLLVIIYIYKSLSQVKTHRNGVYAKLKREMERNVNEAVCLSRLTQSEHSSGINSTSFSVGGIVLHNGNTTNNDFA